MAFLTFEAWLPSYDAFKRALAPIVTKELPDEVTELIRENQCLPRLSEAANSHKAMAAMYYQDYKEKKRPLAQVTWAKVDSDGVASTVKARMIAVSVAMRPLT